MIISISTIQTSAQIKVKGGKIVEAPTPFANFQGKTYKEFIAFLQNHNFLLNAKQIS